MKKTTKGINKPLVVKPQGKADVRPTAKKTLKKGGK